MQEITAYLADDGVVYQNKADAAAADLKAARQRITLSVSTIAVGPDAATVLASLDQVQAVLDDYRVRLNAASLVSP